jgi:hypothetical protein
MKNEITITISDIKEIIAKLDRIIDHYDKVSEALTDANHF